MVNNTTIPSSHIEGKNTQWQIDLSVYNNYKKLISFLVQGKNSLNELSFELYNLFYFMY